LSPNQKKNNVTLLIIIFPQFFSPYKPYACKWQAYYVFKPEKERSNFPFCWFWRSCTWSRNKPI